MNNKSTYSEVSDMLKGMFSSNPYQEMPQFDYPEDHVVKFSTNYPSSPKSISIW